VHRRFASETWYDLRGLTVKSSSPGGLVQKVVYDSVGRSVVTSSTDGGGDTSWADADDVIGDVVLSQDEMTYDSSGLTLVATHRDRFHDETATGSLGTPTSGVKARVSYMGMYYDVGDRSIATVNVGTNGGSIWSRPSTVPTRSDTVLVSSITYDSAGRAFETTDPRGLIARTEYDDLGRTTRTIENYVDGVVGDDNDKTTEYTYGPAGMTSLTAKLTGGGGQTTEWVYGVSASSGSGVTSNDIVAATRWPDPSTGASSSSEQETVLVNALGQPLVTTDRNGNVHTLTYDILGRVVADAVTTLGSGVDGSVRRVETAYDSQGQAYLFTTFDAASGGGVVTQVQRQFNGLGQLIREWQSHSGAVNTSTTPSVQYAYSEMSGGNHSRLASITYPSGYVLTYNYFSGLNGTISRLSSLSDSTGTLESYDYLGLGTVVRRSHPQPDLDLTFLGTGPGAGGDQYVGLDSFGRVVDQHWKHGSISTDRFTYSYDRNGNRLTKGNALNSNFSETYTYDGLNQLSSFVRGNGNTQSWDFDSLGNWDSVTTNGTTQTRSANAQNEIASISGATTPTYDANGNMASDETGKQFVYDAWYRLKVVKNVNGSTLKTYHYDALNRRVVEVVESGTTDLYYSSQWQVLEERVNGAGKYSYVWSPVYVDGLVLRNRLDTSERLWVQQDANFNVTAVVDDSGNVLERYAYGAYGKAAVLNSSWIEISASALGWQYLHQGGRLDLVSILYYYRNRDYSLTLGVWVTVDPIYFKSGDTNLYRYVRNNPLNSIDPFGLADQKNGGPCNALQEILKIWFEYESWMMGWNAIKPVLDIITLYRVAVPAGAGGSVVREGVEAVTKKIAQSQIESAIKKLDVVPENETSEAAGRRAALQFLLRKIAVEIAQGKIEFNTESFCFKLAECESANGTPKGKFVRKNGLGGEVLKCEWCDGKVSYKKWGLKFALGFEKWEGV
jgi:RHS repeat-associated protein